MFKKFMSVLFTGWICLSFGSAQDLASALSYAPAFMTAAQVNNSKIAPATEQGYYTWWFQSDYFLLNGPAKQESYIQYQLKTNANIDSDTCAIYQ